MKVREFKEIISWFNSWYLSISDEVDVKLYGVTYNHFISDIIDSKDTSWE